ncbi:MAG: hypothetical protein ACK587_04265 [Cyanobacteriota bacterium]|jgi:hypothetical protein
MQSPAEMQSGIRLTSSAGQAQSTSPLVPPPEWVPKCFGPEIKRGIAFALQLKEHQIKKADERSGGKDCKFVSPWVLPFALTVVRNNSGDDQHLWFTVWDPDQNAWGKQGEFNGEDVLSLSGPALAQHGDFSYCLPQWQRRHSLVLDSVFDRGWLA